MYRDCITPAIYSDSWATMDTVSEPGVRETSIRTILQSIKITMRRAWSIYIYIYIYIYILLGKTILGISEFHVENFNEANYYCGRVET